MILIANPQAQLVIARGLSTAEAIAQELRDRLTQRLGRAWQHGGYDLLTIARQILDEFEPVLAQTLYDTTLAAWLVGADVVATRIPKLDLPPGGITTGRTGGFGGKKEPPPGLRIFTGEGDEPPIVRFPMIEEAAHDLLRRRLYTAAEFDVLSERLRRNAFTVAHIDNVETVGKIRDTLAEMVEQGPSLRDFKRRMAEGIETSHLGPAHVETTYRTTVQSAYSRGHDAIANDPIVDELFPYTEYLAIHDARARKQHLALERMGIAGTNIYRTVDPFWGLFSPPWDWNCRCGRNLLTIAAAAARGLREAQRWLDTGNAPHMESRLPRIPFRPPAGFVAGWAVGA